MDRELGDLEMGIGHGVAGGSTEMNYSKHQEGET